MARGKPARKAQGRARKASRRTGAAKGLRAGPAAQLLQQDHRRVEKLFGAFVASGDEAQKDGLLRQICDELTIHTILEEEIFYPACRDALAEDESLDIAQVEHDCLKPLIDDLLDSESDDPWRDAKVEVLAAQVRHHVEEEEQPKEGIFALAAAQGVDTDAVAERLRERKEALQGRAAGLRPTRAISLQPRTETEDTMARYSGNDRERDDRGRFMSDDDDDRRSYRGSGGGGGGGSRSRGRHDDDDDDRDSRGRGRGGWFGDSEGHSEASRRGWEERGNGGGSRSRSRDDEDDDRRGYRGSSSSSGGGGGRSRSRYEDDDDDRDRRGRRRGGWFGDSEGHSEAARRGWENSDHGDSGWYGDPEGHSEASRRGWENPRHGRSGWFGDSEGHSEASRRGWDNPRHGRSGWYGDSEGHSRAARRGWDEDDDRRGSRGRGRY